MKSNALFCIPRPFAQRLLFVWVLVACSMSVVAQTQELKVLVSIKPLALLLEPLLSDDKAAGSKLDILLPVNASPHRYALKVSDRQQLADADLVVWVGPDMERFLQKPLLSIDGAKTLAAMNVKGMRWPTFDDDHKGGNHGDSQKGDNRDADSRADGGRARSHYDEGIHDPHFWLDPVNASAFVRAVAERLQVLNPAQSLAYQRRAQNLLAKIEKSDHKIREKLKSLSRRPFVVSHDGFGHFINRYQLNQLAAIRTRVDSKPGARHLYTLRQRIATEKAQCIFIEPGENSGWGGRLANEMDLQAVVLDPLAREEHIEEYTEFIETLALAMEDCLLEGKKKKPLH